MPMERSESESGGTVRPYSQSVGTKRRKAHKLTPLEKKERDRLRKKEQARRRVEAIKNRDEQARLLLLSKKSTLSWHAQERQDEELVLLRLERDMVDPQKIHSATAGYEFSPGMSTSYSPIFHGLSHALCPPSQVRKHIHKRGDQKQLQSAYLHPACYGYSMVSNHDSRCISPVFFFVGFVKRSLNSAVLTSKQKEQSESSEDDLEDNQSKFRDGGSSKQSRYDQDHLRALMAARFLPLSNRCLVCNGTNEVGCPGCFSFSSQRYREVSTSKVRQRLKTPKTHYQEEAERQARHKALQRQLVMPLIYRQQCGTQGNLINQHLISFARKEEDYYMEVLVDFHAIKKDRSITKNFVTLHIKNLPVGNITSLCVDTQSSVSYVYELFRANIDQPNRQIHLLLPTVRGLFYLNEQIQEATDVLNGMVNGDFHVEDFNLQPSRGLPGNGMTTKYEFLLFSVPVLHERSTPQLIFKYVQQNFHLLPHEIPSLDQLAVHYATSLLPNAVDQDLCQLKLIPHVHHMQSFERTNKQLVIIERQEERERLLRLEHQERKQAKIALKKKQNQLQLLNGGRPSQKVQRVISYFKFVCESTSNPRKPKVVEERLEKLWQCFQLMEEWKICKGGRLLDAENNEDTIELMKRHQEATLAAFDQLMDRKTQGPLLYPIVCLSNGSEGGNRRLIIRIGTRLGLTEVENHHYGIVLNFDQELEATDTVDTVATGNSKKLLQRDVTNNKPTHEAGEENLNISKANTFFSDYEWRAKGRDQQNTDSIFFSSTDLLRPPFYQFNWVRMVVAYKRVLQDAAFQVAKLQEFNTLAKVLQTPDVVLSKAQIERWQTDVEQFQSSINECTRSSSCLAQATMGVLLKKGVPLLKKRARMRKNAIRDRIEEMKRLKKLEEESDLPKLTLIQQMKLAFIKDQAPKINAILELTPAEKVSLRAKHLLDKVAASAANAAIAAKKEYNVRTL